MSKNQLFNSKLSVSHTYIREFLIAQLVMFPLWVRSFLWMVILLALTNYCAWINFFLKKMKKRIVKNQRFFGNPPFSLATSLPPGKTTLHCLYLVNPHLQTPVRSTRLFRLFVKITSKNCNWPEENGLTATRVNRGYREHLLLASGRTGAKMAG